MNPRFSAVRTISYLFQNIQSLRYAIDLSHFQSIHLNFLQFLFVNDTLIRDSNSHTKSDERKGVFGKLDVWFKKNCNKYSVRIIITSIKFYFGWSRLFRKLGVPTIAGSYNNRRSIVIWMNLTSAKNNRKKTLPGKPSIILLWKNIYYRIYKINDFFFPYQSIYFFFKSKNMWFFNLDGFFLSWKHVLSLKSSCFEEERKKIF